MSTPLRDALIGVWTLTAYTNSHDGTPDTHPFGPDPRGYLIYTADGIVSAQLMKPDRKPFASQDWNTGTPLEFQQARSGYIAYCGRFWVDEAQRTVTHLPDVALLPNLLHQNQIRNITLHGEQLILRTIGQSGDSTSRLEWVRIASSPTPTAV